jgi:hypothetical protein
MSGETTAKLPAFDLHWSFGLVAHPPGSKDPPRAKLQYEVRAREEVFISDKLWDRDASGKRFPDRFGVYRFVHGMSLRLLFGQAPRDPDIEFRNIYAPLFSRVEAGKVYSNEVLLAVPVDEYSALARDTDEPTEVVHVARVTLIVGYRLRSELKEDPRPPAKESPTVGYIVHDPHQLVSKVDVDELPVKRRKGSMWRVVLPGDQPPGLQTPGQPHGG